VFSVINYLYIVRRVQFPPFFYTKKINHF